MGFLSCDPTKKKETKNTHLNLSSSTKNGGELRKNPIGIIRIRLISFSPSQAVLVGSNCNTTGMNRRQAADAFTENSPLSSFTKRETAESLKSFTSTVGKSCRISW